MSLEQGLQLILGIVMISVAILAIESKKIITSIIYLSLLSLLAVVGFVLLKAPDVAVTEAVIGSGLVTVLFVFTVMGTNKLTAKKDPSVEELDVHPQTEQIMSEGGDKE